MRYPLLLLFLCCTSFAVCQAHLSIDLDEPAYLPEGSVDLGRKSVDTSAAVRELMAIYQTIRYPAAARTYGIMPSVRMIYDVDSMGMVQVVDAAIVTSEDVNANETTFGPPVVITAYQSVTANGSPIATPPPKTTRNQRLLKKGQDAIIAECVRVLVKLPKFVPGRLDGESVTTRFVKYFVFNIE